MKFSNKFIKSDDDIGTEDYCVPAPYFRKCFCLDFEPQKAEITITGLGFYEIYINGKNITKGPLSPYISNPDDIVYYDNYDVSELVTKGKNVIAILLGNGTRNSYGGIVWGFDKAKSRGPVCTAMCLEASNNDKKFELETDETFKTHPSPILYNDLRFEYRYNSNLEIDGWNSVDFDDLNWKCAIAERPPKGKALLCRADNIKIYKELKAVDIKHYDKNSFAVTPVLFGEKAKEIVPLNETVRENVYLFDFGENNAGVTKLKINGKKGQVITIRHLEYLHNGIPSINTVSFVSPDFFEKYIQYGQKDVFICKGGEETFIPKFKYDGFRYAFVEGLCAEQVSEDTLTFAVMSSDIEKRADFICSDNTLNKLQEMTQRSDISNFYYFPTDCPHREKNGWTGDAQLSCEQILLNYNASNSLEVWLENIRAAQDENGVIPGIVPTGGWGYYNSDGIYSNGPAWDCACVNIPYYIYKFDGNKKIISDNLQMIMRMLIYQCSVEDKNGLLNYGLGDWHDPVKWESGSIASPVIVTSSISGYEAASRAAFLFNQAGRTNEAEYAAAVAKRLREAIRKHLIDFETLTVAGNCQTSQAMAIECGVFNEDETAAAGKKLLEIIKRDGFVTMCGCIGLRYIFHALVRIGEWDLAYRLIVCEKRPCYGLWVKLGSTTLQETFPYDDGRDVGSQNHHYMGDISSWLIQEVAGIKPNPGMTDVSEFEISPLFITNLDFAKGYYDSKYGRLSCTWERCDRDIIMNISVPSGMCGTLKLRDGYKVKNGDCLLKEGKHILQIGR